MIFLILGSAGFLGSHLSFYLKAKGHEIISFDIIDSVDEDLRIPNNNILLNLINECDFVYFAACDVGNSCYLKNNETNFDFISNNVLILHNTFYLLKKTGKPFVFISSSMALNAKCTYGLLKLLGEKYTKSLNGLVVRLWNIYGEELKSTKSHCITDFIHDACLNGQITIKTNGAEQRQFLHIKDCCEGLYALTKYYTLVNREEILDLTSFHWISITELISKIKGILKRDIDISWTEIDASYNTIIEPSKYILQFWEARIDLTNGLTDLIINKNRIK